MSKINTFKITEKVYNREITENKNDIKVNKRQ